MRLGQLIFRSRLDVSRRTNLVAEADGDPRADQHREAFRRVECRHLRGNDGLCELPPAASARMKAASP
jgi:hypothetical protein